MTGKPILVAYTTNSGSTGEVAVEIAAQLCQNGQAAEARCLEEVTSLESYGSVVIGAPMILGWHRGAAAFLKKHQQVLSQRRVAFFATAMSLTRVKDADRDEAPALYLDPTLAVAPQYPGRLSLKERYTDVSNYLRPMLKAAPTVKPVSVAFLGGKLEIFRLKWWQALFVMLIVRVQPGDLRNWTSLREWSAQLASLL